jgi:hypothetical protein
LSAFRLADRPITIGGCEPVTLLKTYRRDDDGVLHYLEAWDHDGEFVVHEGKVGQRGRTKTYKIEPESPKTDRGLSLGARWDAFRERAQVEGFVEVPGDEHGWVILQVWTFTADLSHPCDAWIFDEGQDALDAHLGWLGVGNFDGNDIGGSPPPLYAEGTVLNLFCKVVDVELGVKALRSFARKFNIPSAYVIAARGPGVDSEYELAFSPRKNDTEFRLQY